MEIANCGAVAQVGECLLSMSKALGSIPSTKPKQNKILHIRQLSVWTLEAVEVGTQEAGTGEALEGQEGLRHPPTPTLKQYAKLFM
jgi:hypothetical protein